MAKVSAKDQRLLDIHQAHLGLYARVGQTLGVSPSYVSRVARRERKNDKIMSAILAELRKINKQLS